MLSFAELRAEAGSPVKDATVGYRGGWNGHLSEDRTDKIYELMGFNPYS